MIGGVVDGLDAASACGAGSEFRQPVLTSAGMPGFHSRHDYLEHHQPRDARAAVSGEWRIPLSSRSATDEDGTAGWLPLKTSYPGYLIAA